MGVILDTSLLIGAERGTVRIEDLLTSLGDEPVAISAITASELLHGCLRAGSAGVRVRRLAFVEALLDVIPVAGFGLGEARRHAELWAELLGEGAPIGPHDMLIGATALARGDTLATLNVREFQRIAGLRLLPVEPFLT
jgi:tRNA(fMet)-specific endonuclease VapC